MRTRRAAAPNSRAQWSNVPPAHQHKHAVRLPGPPAVPKPPVCAQQRGASDAYSAFPTGPHHCAIPVPEAEAKAEG
jgi:hypothetical protein